MIIIININKFLAWAFDNQWANNHDFYDLFEKYMFQCTVLSLLLLPAKKKDKKKMKVFFIGKKKLLKVLWLAISSHSEPIGNGIYFFLKMH